MPQYFMSDPQTALLSSAFSSNKPRVARLQILGQENLTKMSKNKRKRRLKEEDFKKKKLKVGKKLPMPDNVTRTNFKARSINIGQQNLKQDQDGDQNETNFKGQKLKDLLSSCSHYNSQARVDALLGLKDLIERHPRVLKENLNEVLQRILGLVTDVEFPVRKAFLTVISVLFKTLSETEVTPFFGNVTAYLCSAMTHLNDNIRLDSMKFLDISLQHFPQLVRANSQNIILNFMNVISTERSSMSKGAGIPRMATLKAKVTSQKIQFEMLSRLSRLLNVVFGKGLAVISSVGNGDDKLHDGAGSVGECHKPIVPSQSTAKSVGYHNSGTIAFTGNFHGNIDSTSTGNTFDSTSPSTVHPVLISNFSLKTASGDRLEHQTSSTGVVANEKWLMEYISTLMPVLFEFWVECCPAEFSMNLIPVRRASISLQIMKEILEIFVTLIERLEKVISDQSMFLEYLNKTLFAQFNTHFMTVFPLSFMLQQSGKNSKKVESVESITDVEMNILIAQLLSYFIPELKNDVKNLPRWASEVLKYLEKVFNRKPQLNVVVIKSITNLVKMFLLNLPESFESWRVKLLKSIYKLFECSRPTSNMKKILLEFLAEILDGVRSQHPSMKSILDEWMKSLLKILNNKEVNEEMKYKVFLVCKYGILQKFPNLTSGMINELPHIVAVEEFLTLSEDVQRLVIEILYHIGEVPSHELFGVLSKLCMSKHLSLRVFKYLLLVIYQLVHSNSNSPVVSTIADYLSFMLSVVVGLTQNHLEDIQIIEKHSNSFSHEVSELNTLVFEFEIESGNSEVWNEGWEHTTEVIEIVCKFLVQSDYSARFLEMLEDPLCKLFEKFPILPLNVVYRLLYLVKILLCLAKEGDTDHSCGKLLEFIANWCSLLRHFSLTVLEQFQEVDIIHTIVKHLNAITSELCSLSEVVLKNMLDSFIPLTLPHYDSLLTCQVLTDMFKQLEGKLTLIHQPTLKVLYQNLESKSYSGLLDSQAFSDFKYHYKVCTQVFKAL